MAGSIREALESAMKDAPAEEEQQVQETVVEDRKEEVPAASSEQLAGKSAEHIKDDGTGDTGEKSGSDSSADKEQQPSIEARKDEPAAEEVPEKAPVSWKAGAKERWKAVPKEVREEVLRREREIDLGLKQASVKTRIADRFQETIAPYRTVIAAEGLDDPIKAVEGLMKTATALRMGTPIQKAKTIAQLIEFYGVDIQSLDQVLSGNASTALDPQAQLREMLQAELAPIRQTFEQQTRSQQEQIQAQAASAIEQFVNSGKAEFFDDLREDIADLLDMAAKRNRVMSLEEAYERAAAAHPEISKVVRQRQLAASSGDVARKKQAASSVSGSPSPSPSNAPTDIRGALLAAMEKHGGR